MTGSDEPRAAAENPALLRIRRLVIDHLYGVLAATTLPLSPFHLIHRVEAETRRQYHSRKVIVNEPSQGSDAASSSDEEEDDEHVALKRFQKCGEQDMRRLCKELAATPQHGGAPVLREWWGCYLLASREMEMARNALVTRDYQALEMTVLVTEHPRLAVNAPPRCVVYVPASAEHRFVEVRESTISGAGLGLFLRSSRRLRQGTVLCEYAGRRLLAPPKDASLCPYMIQMSRPDAAGHRFIDGVDGEGNLLCLASLINDCGEDGATVEFVEFPALPGRIFVSALRDLQPGRELFVCYGRGYWGTTVSTASTAAPLVAPAKRHRIDVPMQQRCRRCGGMFANRLLHLHMRTCGDVLQEKRVASLESLPMNEFTMLDDQMSVKDKFRLDMRALPRRSITFVSASDASTVGMSHVHVVDFLRVEVLDSDDDATAV